MHPCLPINPPKPTTTFTVEGITFKRKSLKSDEWTGKVSSGDSKITIKIFGGGEDGMLSYENIGLLSVQITNAKKVILTM